VKNSILNIMIGCASIQGQHGVRLEISIIDFSFPFALTLESQGKLVYNRENVLPVLLDLPMNGADSP